MIPQVKTAGNEIHVGATGSVSIENIYTHPAILSNGSFVVIYQGSNREVYQRHYNKDGTPKGAAEIVTTALGAAASEPGILTLDGGGYMIYWKQSGVSGSEIEAQRFNKNGNPQGDVIQVTSATTLMDKVNVIELTNGKVLMTWTEYHTGDGYSIKGQYLRANGSTQGGEFELRSGQLSNQADIVTVPLKNGEFALIWDDSKFLTADGVELNVQKFDKNGSPRGPVSTVSLPDTAGIGLTTQGGVKEPSVTELAKGGFVVTWWGGFGSDGSTWGVFGHMFNSKGKPVGSEFQLNTTTDSQQWAPDIEGLPDGGFIAAWQSFNQDGSGEAIVGQRFDAKGKMVGDEFIVNTSTGAAQFYSGIDVADDGSFVISWQSHHLGSNQWQIMAQNYKAQMIGTNGKDVMIDKVGANEMYGLGSSDKMFGKGGNDLMFGGDKDDVMEGGRNNDRMFGENGNDTLRGDSGKDILKGGKGGDVLIGGQGNDTLVGGGGADSFKFNNAKNEGRDKIVDFQDGVDVLTIKGSNFSNTDIQSTTGGTLVTLAGGTEIFLKGIDSNLITSDDFDFI